jgi:large subunit ribosomal protein L1
MICAKRKIKSRAGSRVKNIKMAEIEVQLKKALTDLRATKERKFDQTVDLIVNLQKFDVKKSNVNIFVNVPHKIRDKKIAGFLEVKNKDIDTITPDEFKKYTSKLELKKLVNSHDFFIAQASLMPSVATSFGRSLGPTGKMPSPQLGIIMNADEKTLKELKTKINTSVKIKIKEPSIKLSIGKQSMNDEDIIENIMTVYNMLLKTLPRNKENIKNIEIKFTMTKPQKISVK